MPSFVAELALQLCDQSSKSKSKGSFSVATPASRDRDCSSRPSRLIAIHRGGAIGIFDCWEKAKVYIAGYQKAEFNSFSSRIEAEAWVAAGKDNAITDKAMSALR